MESAAKIFVKIQPILTHKLGISDFVDPIGGSYFIESLTHQIESQIYEEFLKIESLGRTIAAIEESFYASQITVGAVRRQRHFDRGERISIEANEFRNEWEIPSGAFKIDQTVEERQLARLNKIQEKRNGKHVREKLERVGKVTLGDGNLVSPILETVPAIATIREICGMLREVFGKY